MRALFAPDYRAGLGYQRFLARELERIGIHVDFLSHYRRGFPLYRGSKDFSFDILHIHWPEVYFSRKQHFDWFRKIRYAHDLSLAVGSRRRLFLTAHNLLPHNRHSEPGVFAAVRETVRRSAGVFAHSENARQQLVDIFQVESERVWLIPYGDHTDGWDAPLDRVEAREQLNLNANEKICLIFGTVSPYKGTDDVVRYWVKASPNARLVVIGPVLNENYAKELRELAAASSQVELRISSNWLNDADLHLWLSAVDCTIFNYREIFTSGAAALARSMGVPLLIPDRLRAADLHEPHHLVYRFESLETNFGLQLQCALTQQPDYSSAADWRRETSWEVVARITAEAYGAASGINRRPVEQYIGD
jgi:glycosyltransferase involved in cell wall biosynthesis